DIHAGHGLRLDHEPVYRERCVRYRITGAVAEQLRVGEEERRIPAQHHEPREQACCGIARDVVVALHAVHSAEDRGMRAPPIPEELEYRDDDGQGDTGYGAEDRYAGEADHR